jgi:hypothetical protein
MNVAEFLAWTEARPDDRYELVDGEIIDLSPPGMIVTFAALLEPSPSGHPGI